MTTNSPLISVVTVVRNSVETLETTILSVVNQDYPHREYLMIDGLSTDGTLEVIEKYRNHFNQFSSSPDKGIYDAMNKACTMASGDFLIFMNAGDTFYSSQTLSDFASGITNQEAVYYGNALYVERENQVEYPRGGKFNKYRLSKTNLCHQTVFYPAKVYRTKKYNLKYPISADWAYHIELFRNTQFIWIDQVIARFDATGISAKVRDRVFARDQKILFLRHLGLDVILYLTFRKIKDILTNYKLTFS